MFNRKINELIRFYYVWIIYAVLQLLWVQDLTLYGTFFRILLINFAVIVFIIIYVQCFSDWMFVLHAFLVMIIVSLLVGFWEIKTGNHLVEVSEQIQYIYIYRPVAFYGNENDYATVLALGVFAVLIHFVLLKKSWFLFLVDGSLLAVIIIQMVMTTSRGAIYSLFLMVVLLLVMLSATNASRKLKHGRQLSNCFLILIALVVTFLLITNFTSMDLLKMYSNTSNYISDVARIQMIRNGVKALFNSFGLGVGPGQSILANGVNLHFFYLEIIVDYGLFVGGYLLFLFFRLSFWVPSTLENKRDIWGNAIVRSFPITLILLGISSSGMIRLRSTWVVFSLFYLYAYGCLDKKTRIEGVGFLMKENILYGGDKL